jgi:methyl-accepting chemotaxis protein
MISFVVILVVVGIGMTAQGQVSERVTNEKMSTVQTNAELEASSFGAWLEGQKQQVQTLSNHRSLQSDDESRVRSGLNGELENMPAEVAALHYVNLDTERIAVSTEESVEGRTVTTNESTEGFDVSPGTVIWNPEQPFGFENRSESFVLESFVYKEDGEPSVALASRVPGSNYAVVSVIRTNVRAEQFSSSINGTRTVAIGGFTGLVLFSENKLDVLTSYKGEGNSTLEERVRDPDVSNTGALVTHSRPRERTWSNRSASPKRHAKKPSVPNGRPNS